jgi:mevalonate kinase
MSDSQSYYSHGKLLITGEYLVLFGAKALAVPLRYGQNLCVNDCPEKSRIIWTAKELDKIWFEAELRVSDLSLITTTDHKIASRLILLLLAARELNPDFLSRPVQVETDINFPRSWGLGTSSTLTANVAEWAGVDPFQLHWKTSSGSGYDVACALHTSPIIYQVTDRVPKMDRVPFFPAFHEQLYFVYLGEKQDSAKSIAEFHSLHQERSESIRQISQITLEISEAADIVVFMKLLTRHEFILSSNLNLPTVKESLFPDFNGVVKSLGAWGGDFVMAVSLLPEKEISAYFRALGYPVIFPYAQMVMPC